MLHYHATFASGGTDHQLDVWRDGERRVKRVTDSALETYAFRQPGDANFTMEIVDRRKRVSTHIDRTTMLRLGSLTNWFDLTHGLRQPRGDYKLVRSDAPDGAPKPFAACDWYALTQSRRQTQLCWSSVERLPMLIVSAGGMPVWRITALDRRTIPALAFAVRDKEFVRVNAVADAERD